MLMAQLPSWSCCGRMGAGALGCPAPVPECSTLEHFHSDLTGQKSHTLYNHERAGWYNPSMCQKEGSPRVRGEQQ